jgi:hypothetical protein
MVLYIDAEKIKVIEVAEEANEQEIQPEGAQEVS